MFKIFIKKVDIKNLLDVIHQKFYLFFLELMKLYHK